jgi:hypothetical protein
MSSTLRSRSFLAAVSADDRRPLGHEDGGGEVGLFESLSLAVERRDEGIECPSTLPANVWRIALRACLVRRELR